MEVTLTIQKHKYSYCFSDISVGIWRQNIPENFSEYEIKDATEEEKNIWKTEKNKAKFKSTKEMIELDTTNMCSHLQKKLFNEMEFTILYGRRCKLMTR